VKSVASGIVPLWEFACPLCGGTRYVLNPDPDVSYSCGVCRRFRGRMDEWACDEYVSLQLVLAFDDGGFQVVRIREVMP